MTDRALKRCPDCAEDVMAEARRCRFCGYRFDAPASRRFDLLGLLTGSRRATESLTPAGILEAWGIQLGSDESVRLLAEGRIGAPHGYLAITDHRVIVLEHRGGDTYGVVAELPRRSSTGIALARGRLRILSADADITLLGIHADLAARVRELLGGSAGESDSDDESPARDRS